MKYDKKESQNKMLALLMDGRGYTAEELAHRIGKDVRTVHRYMNDLRNKDVPIHNQPGLYQVPANMAEWSKASSPLFFDEEENRLLEQMCLQYHSYDPAMRGLLCKLSPMIDPRLLPHLEQLCQRDSRVDLLLRAIEKRTQVTLVDYESSHGNKTENRHVEPVLFSRYYRQVQCYDLDRQDMRTFAIERMSEVVDTGKPWEHEEEHQRRLTDDFWMNGETMWEVTLRMTTRAKNALAANMMACERTVTVLSDSPTEEVGEKRYEVTLRVCQEAGIRHFLQSQEGEVEVVRDGANQPPRWTLADMNEEGEVD